MVGKPLPTSFQAGYPPKMLQEIMGHARITTTLDLYGHLYPGDMDRYADRLGDAAELLSIRSVGVVARQGGKVTNLSRERDTCFRDKHLDSEASRPYVTR